MASPLDPGSLPGRLDHPYQRWPVKPPLPEAVQAVMDGRITHGPSCVLILKAQHLLHGGRVK